MGVACFYSHGDNDTKRSRGKNDTIFLPKEQAPACWGVSFINYHNASLWLKRCDFNRIVLAFEFFFCKSPKT